MDLGMRADRGWDVGGNSLIRHMNKSRLGARGFRYVVHVVAVLIPAYLDLPSYLQVLAVNRLTCYQDCGRPPDHLMDDARTHMGP